MVFKDYYKVLGFDTNKVTIDEIKNAYREMAKKYHPDRNVGDSSSEEIFKEINEAYKVLSTPKIRRKYDFNWNRYFGKKKTETHKEKRTFKEILFNIFFGNIIKTSPEKKKNQEPVYGENINTRINVSLQEAYLM